jgi:hypothetical protein
MAEPTPQQLAKALNFSERWVQPQQQYGMMQGMMNYAYPKPDELAIMADTPWNRGVNAQIQNSSPLLNRLLNLWKGGRS